jgi:DNA polymerase-1
VDGHSYAYRAFYAIRQLKSPTGKPTNAIYGFIKMFEKMLEAVAPSNIVVLWDGGLDSERMALLPEYKAQRAEMPEDLSVQMDEIIAYLDAQGVVSWMKEGVEADDCIATLSLKAVESGCAVVIASSDKDFMQLVTPQIQLLLPSDRSEGLVGPEQVELKTGVRPEQIVDWLSLIGDAVDNIRGVEGVGAKTATSLLKQHGSLEKLYERLEAVSSERLRKSLAASRDVVVRNQKMIRLKTDVSCEETLETLQLRERDVARLKLLFAEWGFKSMLRELEQAQESTADLFEAKAGVCAL